MSQQRFDETTGDKVAAICNHNFDELYSTANTAAANALLGIAAGKPFRLSAQLTSAAAATPVHVVPAASVGTAEKIYIEKVFLKVGGATAWTDVTATKVQLQDTNGSPVVGMTWLKALLLGNAVNSDANASTLGAAVVDGLTAAKGLDFVADANFAAGSTITIIVFGFIA